MEEQVQFFAEGGVYHSMPIGPVVGHARLRPFIAAFLKSWTGTQWDVPNLAAAGDVMFVERSDRTKIADKSVDLACCGV